ncbi:porin family protein, partial [Ochrobactrum sp. MR28]|nr:porin family protein [Ochrobactrum sp. MR28]
LGGGVGYQVTGYFRTDLTVDYLTRAKFSGSTSGVCTANNAYADCVSNDTAKMSALSILANAYIDLGNFNGFTPYVGAGIGGTR